MRRLHHTAQPEFDFMRVHDNLHRCALRKRQRHFQVTAAGAQVGQATMIRHRDSGAEDLRSQPARVADFVPPVSGLGAQTRGLSSSAGQFGAAIMPGFGTAIWAGFYAAFYTLGTHSHSPAAVLPSPP